VPLVSDRVEPEVLTLFGSFNPAVQDHIVVWNREPGVGAHLGRIVAFLLQVVEKPRPNIVRVTVISVDLFYSANFRLVEGPDGPEGFRGSCGSVPDEVW
jgi:hypothetical protein